MNRAQHMKESTVSKKNTQSAQERREAQREALRAKRQAEIKRQKTVRTAIIAVVAIAALALASVAGLFIYRSISAQAEVVPPPSIAEGKQYLTVGAPEGSGAPVVEVHLDYMCPYCGQFEQINATDIKELVDSEAMTYNVVFRRALDAQSTTGNFSTRASNASVCVYEENPANLLPFMDQIYKNQPAQGSAGLTDEQLIQFAQNAGASADVSSCITNQTYRPWVRQVSDPYGAGKADGTPYVEINGEENTSWNQPGSLRAAIEAAAG